MALLVTVLLQRAEDNIPWGFRIQGGADYDQPLSVQRVTPGTIASQLLTPGDVLIMIEGQDARLMCHFDACELIKMAGNTVELIVRKANSKHLCAENLIQQEKLEQQVVEERYRQEEEKLRKKSLRDAMSPPFSPESPLEHLSAEGTPAACASPPLSSSAPDPNQEPLVVMPLAARLSQSEQRFGEPSVFSAPVPPRGQSFSPPFPTSPFPPLPDQSIRFPPLHQSQVEDFQNRTNNPISPPTLTSSQKAFPFSSPPQFISSKPPIVSPPVRFPQQGYFSPPPSAPLKRFTPQSVETSEKSWNYAKSSTEITSQSKATSFSSTTQMQATSNTVSTTSVQKFQREEYEQRLSRDGSDKMKSPFQRMFSPQSSNLVQRRTSCSPHRIIPPLPKTIFPEDNFPDCKVVPFPDNLQRSSENVEVLADTNRGYEDTRRVYQKPPNQSRSYQLFSPKPFSPPFQGNEATNFKSVSSPPPHKSSNYSTPVRMFSPPCVNPIPQPHIGEVSEINPQVLSRKLQDLQQGEEISSSSQESHVQEEGMACELQSMPQECQPLTVEEYKQRQLQILIEEKVRLEEMMMIAKRRQSISETANQPEVKKDPKSSFRSSVRPYLKGKVNTEGSMLESPPTLIKTIESAPILNKAFEQSPNLATANSVPNTTPESRISAIRQEEEELMLRKENQIRDEKIRKMQERRYEEKLKRSLSRSERDKSCPPETRAKESNHTESKDPKSRRSRERTRGGSRNKGIIREKSCPVNLDQRPSDIRRTKTEGVKIPKNKSSTISPFTTTMASEPESQNQQTLTNPKAITTSGTVRKLSEVNRETGFIPRDSKAPNYNSLTEINQHPSEEVEEKCISNEMLKGEERKRLFDVLKRDQQRIQAEFKKRERAKQVKEERQSQHKDKVPSDLSEATKLQNDAQQWHEQLKRQELLNKSEELIYQQRMKVYENTTRDIAGDRTSSDQNQGQLQSQETERHDPKTETEYLKQQELEYYKVENDKKGKQKQKIELERQISERQAYKKKELEKQEREKQRLYFEKEQIERELLRRENNERELQRQQMEREELQRQQIEREELQRQQIEREELQRQQIEREELQRQHIEREELQRQQIERDELQRQQIEREELQRQQIEREELQKQIMEQERLETQKREREELEKQKREKEKVARHKRETEEKERKEQESIKQKLAKEEFERLELERQSQEIEKRKNELREQQLREREISRKNEIKKLEKTLGRELKRQKDKQNIKREQIMETMNTREEHSKAENKPQSASPYHEQNKLPSKNVVLQQRGGTQPNRQKSTKEELASSSTPKMGQQVLKSDSPYAYVTCDVVEEENYRQMKIQEEKMKKEEETRMKEEAHIYEEYQKHLEIKRKTHLYDSDDYASEIDTMEDEEDPQRPRGLYLEETFDELKATSEEELFEAQEKSIRNLERQIRKQKQRERRNQDKQRQPINPNTKERKRLATKQEDTTIQRKYSSTGDLNSSNPSRTLPITKFSPDPMEFGFRPIETPHSIVSRSTGNLMTGGGPSASSIAHVAGAEAGVAAIKKPVTKKFYLPEEADTPEKWNARFRISSSLEDLQQVSSKPPLPLQAKLRMNKLRHATSEETLPNSGRSCDDPRRHTYAEGENFSELAHLESLQLDPADYGRLLNEYYAAYYETYYQSFYKRHQSDLREGKMMNLGPPPPPPPPPFSTGPPAPSPKQPVEVPSKAPPPTVGPPAAIAKAMLEDKKPFTYTPGGINLAEIKSPRMQRRLQRNASLEGVRPSPLAQQPPPPTTTGVTPIMPPQGMIQVLPMPGMGMGPVVKRQPKEPKEPPKPKRNVCGPAPPPPPFSVSGVGSIEPSPVETPSTTPGTTPAHNFITPPSTPNTSSTSTEPSISSASISNGLRNDSDVCKTQDDKTGLQPVMASEPGPSFVPAPPPPPPGNKKRFSFPSTPSSISSSTNKSEPETNVQSLPTSISSSPKSPLALTDQKLDEGGSDLKPAIKNSTHEDNRKTGTSLNDKELSNQIESIPINQTPPASQINKQRNEQKINEIMPSETALHIKKETYEVNSKPKSPVLNSMKVHNVPSEEIPVVSDKNNVDVENKKSHEEERKAVELNCSDVKINGEVETQKSDPQPASGNFEEIRYSQPSPTKGTSSLKSVKTPTKSFSPKLNPPSENAVPNSKTQQISLSNSQFSSHPLHPVVRMASPPPISPTVQKEKRLFNERLVRQASLPADPTSPSKPTNKGSLYIPPVAPQGSTVSPTAQNSCSSPPTGLNRGPLPWMCGVRKEASPPPEFLAHAQRAQERLQKQRSLSQPECGRHHIFTPSSKDAPDNAFQSFDGPSFSPGVYSPHANTELVKPCPQLPGKPEQIHSHTWSSPTSQNTNFQPKVNSYVQPQSSPMQSWQKQPSPTQPHQQQQQQQHQQQQQQPWRQKQQPQPLGQVQSQHPWRQQQQPPQAPSQQMPWQYQSPPTQDFPQSPQTQQSAFPSQSFTPAQHEQKHRERIIPIMMDDSFNSPSSSDGKNTPGGRNQAPYQPTSGSTERPWAKSSSIPASPLGTGGAFTPYEVQGKQQSPSNALEALQQMQQNLAQLNSGLQTAYPRAINQKLHQNPSPKHPQFSAQVQPQANGITQSPTYGGGQDSAMQSRSFKVIQKAYDSQDNTGNSTQNVMPEPKKYTGSYIPSRSFRMLQAMTDSSDVQSDAPNPTTRLQGKSPEDENTSQADNFSNSKSNTPLSSLSFTSLPSSTVSSNKPTDIGSQVAPSYTSTSDSHVYRQVVPKIVNKTGNERVVNSALSAKRDASPRPWHITPSGDCSSHVTVVRCSSIGEDNNMPSPPVLESPSRLLNIIKQETSEPDGNANETKLLYEGSHIPSRVFKQLQNDYSNRNVDNEPSRSSTPSNRVTEVHIPRLIQQLHIDQRVGSCDEEQYHNDITEVASAKESVLKELTSQFDPQMSLKKPKVAPGRMFRYLQQQYDDPQDSDFASMDSGLNSLSNNPSPNNMGSSSTSSGIEINQPEIEPKPYAGCRIPGRTFRLLQENTESHPSVFKSEK